MELPLVFFLVLILAAIYCYITKNKNNEEGTKEGFCQRGWCPEDMQNRQEFLQKIHQRWPCSKKYSMMGYDNPYIYPYNYFWNQNQPTDKFKYPGWVRQLTKSLTDDYGFPGYAV